MIEADILHWFESLHGSVLDPIMMAITQSATSGVIWFIIAVLISLRTRNVNDAAKIVFAVVLADILVDVVLKDIVCRPRPFKVIDLDVIGKHPSSYSFPSGHTGTAFAGAVAVFLINRKVGTALVVYAFFVGISRMYLCVHWPTDVLGGAVIGTLSAIAVMLYVNRLSSGRDSDCG